jgi:hypothetical protein
MGKIRWNYRVNERRWEDDEIKVSRPRRSLDECMLVDGLHEPIISEELFYRANERKSKNVPLKKSNELKNPLAGIFFCGKCGRAMKLRTGDSKNKPRFECTNMKYCGNGSARYTDVMNELCDALLEYIGDFEVKVTNDDVKDEIAHHQLMIHEMEKRLSEVERKEIALWDKYAEEGMPKHIFDKLIDKVKSDKAELKESIQNAYENLPKKVDYEERVYMYSTLLDYLRNDELSAKVKNDYLRDCIKRIEFTREKSIRLTKELAEEMGVPYPYPLAVFFLSCRHFSCTSCLRQTRKSYD